MPSVMIIDSNLIQDKPLKKSLLDNGFNVIAHVTENASWSTEYHALAPDIIIFDTESPSQNILVSVATISQENTQPIIMFAQDGDRASVKAATKAGVAAYVVGDIPSNRLTPVVEAAIARFEETKQLRDELQQANSKLDERKTIERAKGILMRQRDLDEEGAYKMLRGMAMQRNKKLVDVSNQLIDAAKMLIA